ncbi:hypothetical protein BCR36DRAFT_413598 [Piromyces finnis]|uniref:Uncharacterized protein n=1 Tax=Piromyces finnis TaxID=1754191 RepID=A0A1Y1V6G1_9FUNG|nr:hypothetical protein BCR36DRAFT_413598 [Piromyces finnis]|eukprot:ORX47659.1 hypothetical protein BCR36DRAFT_413598 [Piromyces finnis]
MRNFRRNNNCNKKRFYQTSYWEENNDYNESCYKGKNKSKYYDSQRQFYQTSYWGENNDYHESYYEGKNKSKYYDSQRQFYQTSYWEENNDYYEPYYERGNKSKYHESHDPSFHIIRMKRRKMYDKEYEKSLHNDYNYQETDYDYKRKIKDYNYQETDYDYKRKIKDYNYQETDYNYKRKIKDYNYQETDYDYKRKIKDYNYQETQDYERNINSKYYNNYNVPDLNKRMIKIQEMLDKEQECEDALLNGYNYLEALDFFKEICKYENCVTLVWDNDELDINRLSNVDFGKFDQRKKFIDMFENYDGNGINISMRVNFSYGGFCHDMYIEQPESYEYDTNKFIFINNITFNEEQCSDERAYIKPYLSKKNKNGILAKFIKYPEKIQSFAINVLRIMKLSPKGTIPVDLWPNLDRVLTFESFEIAGMILSTERLRSKKALLLSYIEFYKLKHVTNHNDSLSMLLDMFDKDGPTLRFPASPGGIEAIQKTSYYYIYKRFLNMIQYSPEYEIIQQCKNRNIQRNFMDEFFRGLQVEIEYTSNKKIVKTSETVPLPENGLSPKNTERNVVCLNSKVKNSNNNEYFDDYLNNISDSDYDSIFNNVVFSLETSSSQHGETESSLDEDFDNDFDNFSDTDYDSIVNNIVSSGPDSSQQEKTESSLDEDFDNDFDNFSDTDYDSIVNNAISSQLCSSQ